MDTPFIHPEIREGEVFFSNTNADQFASLSWESKRQGECAYDGEGHELIVDDWHPVFLTAQELREHHTDLTQLRREFRMII